MAEVTPTVSPGSSGGARGEIVWTGIDNSDTVGAQKIQGGKYTLGAAGTFDSATVTFQFSADGTNFINIDTTNLQFTAAGLYNVELGNGFLKASISGGGGSQSLVLSASPINFPES